MSDITNNSLTQQVYSTQTDDATQQPAYVICILMPRALTVAGFGSNGELLTVRNSDYKNNLPAWILDFYEHQFINEPLLAAPERVVAAYIATEKNYIVPDELYERTAAIKWMQHIHFIENNEVITTEELDEDKARYIYAYPDGVKGMLTRYFSRAHVMPFATYQFQQRKAADVLQCCITNDTAFATLHIGGKLQWHQAFGYENAEDIAYQLKLACKQAKANDVTLQCTTTSKGLTYVANELASYFPASKDGNATTAPDTSWASTIYLLQQLYACAL